MPHRLRPSCTTCEHVQLSLALRVTDSQTRLSHSHVERAWEALAEEVRTGVPAFPRARGVDLWNYLAAHTEQDAYFAATMTGGAEDARALLPAQDLSGVGTLVDIGVGRGRLLAVVLAAILNLRSILFD